MNDRQLIEDLLSALEYHTEQTRPIQFSTVAIEAAREYLRKPEQPAQQDLPDLIAGALGVSRGTAYDMMREALAEQPAQQEPVQQGILARKWILHGGFADVASFDSEGVPSFYGKESVAKFQKGQLSAPCKGKNCGSLNGWLHSAECRAEHEANYTTPQAQPAREPLTHEQINKAAEDEDNETAFLVGFYAGARFAEAAHGITKGNT